MEHDHRKDAVPCSAAQQGPAAPTAEGPSAAPPVPGLLGDPTVRRMTVGAAHDPMEAAADEAAARAVALLQRSGPPAGGNAGGAASAPSGPIGAAGGDLDAASSSVLQSSRGGGTPLSGGIRRSMETALGGDLGGVRLHTSATARALSERMSAEAFTVGKDVFFRDGMPSTSSASGQALLAHELAHTLQPDAQVHRFDIGRLNPFRTKTDAEKQAAEQKKQLEARRKQEKGEAKAKAKAASTEAKAANAKNKEVSKASAAGYEAAGEAGKLTKTDDHAQLESAFAALLAKEATARETVKARTRAAMVARGKSASEADAEAELAAERASDLTWSQAPPQLRAFRPLRFDEFDKAMNEVKQARLDDMALHHSDVTAVLAKNDADLGAQMSPEKAGKKVAEQRTLDRRRDRIAQEKGQTADALEDEVSASAAGSFASQLSALQGERKVGAGEMDRIGAKTVADKRQAAFGKDDELAEHQGNVQTASKGIGYAGTAWKSGANALGTKDQDATDANSLVGTSLGGVSGILTMVSEIMSFVGQVKEIGKGGTDKGAGLQAASTAVSVVKGATSTTRTSLLAIKEGVTAFGGSAGALANATTALPIVGLIGSVLEIISSTIDALPTTERLAGGSVALEEAKREDRAPLVAAVARGQRRNGQLLEKSLFDIAKSSTMVGLHIAEVASAGGFGVPAAAKLTITLAGLGHTAAHAIYDQFVESSASEAKHAYFGAHDEGATRDLVKYDASTAVDLITVAAKKHSLPYAVAWLEDYGVHEAEVRSMRMHEIREKVLAGLKETDDPKTVAEKVEGVAKTVKETLGLDDPPGPKGEEKSALEKVKAAPGKALDALAGLPGKISKKAAEIQGKYKDAEELVAKKNEMGYKGNSSRGVGSATYNFLRGEDAIEKSYAKVRYDLKGDKAGGEMPYTRAHKEARQKTADKKSHTPDAGIIHNYDKAFAAQLAKADVPGLYALVAGVGKADEDKLRLIELEVQRRMAAAGGGA